MIHIAGHQPDPSWSTRFYMWGTRAHRYLVSPLVLAIAAIGGAFGLVLSVSAGTALMWAIVAVVGATIAFAVLLTRHQGLRSVRPHWWAALVLAVFFNQAAIDVPAVYFPVAIGAFLAALIPPLLHGVGWLFFALSPATD